MSFAIRSSNAVADINITPLVDVMLVLLVIFMLSVPVIERQLPMDLPQIDRERPPPPTTEPLHLRISAEGQWLLDGRLIGTEELRAILALESRREPQPVLQIDPAADAPYQQLTTALTIARNAEMDKIAFTVD